MWRSGLGCADIVKTYGSWTSVANGSELEEDEDTDRRPTGWNNAFFKLVAYCLPGLTSPQIDEIALAGITSLPDEAFFDVTTAFLREVDGVHFNDHALQDAQAVQVRSALAHKIMTTRAWERHARDRLKSTEIHFGPAAAVVLFNDYWSLQLPKCYLNAKGIDRLAPFFSLLKEVAESGQFFLAVIALLNLLEVAPRSSLFAPDRRGGKSWLAANPDEKDFWVDQGIGRRLCALMEAMSSSRPDTVRSESAAQEGYR